MTILKPKLTPIFSRGNLRGYALTINGEVIGRQFSCEINTSTNSLAKVVVTFGVNDEMLTDAGRIDT